MITVTVWCEVQRIHLRLCRIPSKPRSSEPLDTPTRALAWMSDFAVFSDLAEHCVNLWTNSGSGGMSDALT